MKIATYVKSALAASTLLLAVSTLPATAYADTAFYQVSNVQNDDTLNIRSGAGANFPVIGTIPHNGRTVMSTGQTQKNGRTTWAEVVWLGQIGWVNKRYLIDSSQATWAPATSTIPAASVNNDANAHTHPSNRCTRSISHTHPNGAGTHKHHYSCDPNSNTAAPAPAVKSNYQPTMAADPNSHNHPSNACTNSITHTHPNGAGSHQHRYSCDPNRNNAPARVMKSNYQPKLPADPNAHTHPSNECTNSVTHTHPNGAGSHQHHYSCQKTAAPQPQYQPQPKYSAQPEYSNTNDYYAIQ